MQDVMTLNAIAEEIKTHSDTCIPLSKQIIQMAEDFDLGGIQKLADALEKCWLCRLLDYELKNLNCCIVSANLKFNGGMETANLS